MTGDATRTEPKPPPVDRVSLLWQRINEHKIVQWSVAYVALAYAIQHAIILTSESLEWPSTIARVSMLLLIFGLPLVMLLAWYHGQHASRSVSKAEASIIALLLAVGSLWFYAFVNPHEQTAGSTPRVQEAGLTQARRAAGDQHGAISVAVLPFVNLSSDKEQEYFSDGMTEEITAALAKVPDLRVVARTSAFEFKGKNIEIVKIGEQLHATHLIEGSVRKAGNRVRITAQLIKADDGTHIWAEDYDRELTDVFAVQEDIARAITGSLHMTLGLKPGENLVSDRTADPAVHDAYLRAKTLVRANLPEAIRLLNDVVQRDPNYAPAWGVLARAYQLSILLDSSVIRGAMDEAIPLLRDYGGKAAMAAEKAYRLDPNNSDAVYGYSAAREGRLDLARMTLLERALALDADNPEPLQSYSFALAGLGFTKQALKVRDHLTSVEPFGAAYRAGVVRLLFADGQLDEAIKLGEAAVANGGNGVRLFLAQAYAAQGRFREAADTLALTKGPDAKSQQSVTQAAEVLRGGPAPMPPNERPELGVLNWIYVYRGVPEKFAETYDKLTRAGIPPGLSNGIQFAPAYAPMRKTPAFKQYIRDTGALEYWRAKGWPPQCHPTTGDDFACE